MKLRETDRFYVVSLLWIAMLMLLATGTWAAETDLDSKARALDQGVTTREERSAIFTKFGVPTTPPYGSMPPGQALVLWSLCGTSTACQERALADRKAHMGWGKVAEDLKAQKLTTDAKVGQAVRQVTDAHRDLAAKAGRERTLRGEGATSSSRPEHPSREMGRPGR
jgi:hypothetical protein